MNVLTSPTAESFTTRDGRPILIRLCNGFDEFAACVRLQFDTWGYSDDDIIPRRAFIVAKRIGGQIVGAFDVSQSPHGEPEHLVGFALALPGIKTTSTGPMPYIHSHMLAVENPLRNEGIGRRLKLFQRIEAIQRGIQLMEWTFDPLEIKNSFLNIHKLGVVVRSYTSNFYGVSSSRLQGGLPTDRLHAEWHLDSDRVKAILNGNAPPLPEIQESIHVPRDIGIWKSSEENVNRALAVQTENRQRFQAAFSRGLSVVGFQRDPQGNGIFQLASFDI